MDVEYDDVDDVDVVDDVDDDVDNVDVLCQRSLKKFALTAPSQ